MNNVDYTEVPLREIAHARTGDKGNRTNISLIAYDARHYDLLVEQVTPERVAQQFAYRKPSHVARYLLPKIGAMNFVLDDVLDGGVNDSLNLDMHGKALSFHLLAITVQVPIAMRLADNQGDRMKLIRLLALGAMALATVCAQPALAQAQDYPKGPVKMIVPFPPGSATDLAARVIGQQLADRARQAVRGREQAGCAGHDRRTGSRARRARWPDAAVYIEHGDRIERSADEEDAVRPDEGLYAGGRRRYDRVGVDGEAGLSRKEPEGVHRVREATARQARRGLWLDQLADQHFAFEQDERTRCVVGSVQRHTARGQ